MPIAPPARMTAETFLSWAAEQPQGRFELSGGEVIAMPPERAIHALTKGAAFRSLGDAVRDAGLAAQVFPDGMSVRIEASTVFEPDVLVRCGPRVADQAIFVEDPVIVVEVVSPSSRGIDTGMKLEAYFRHYLILRTDSRVVIHHARVADGTIRTTILAGGSVSLDPPGIEIDVATLFS